MTTVNDRFQVVSDDGLVVAVPTRAQAFHVGEKYARANPAMRVEVFDCMAHVGAPECWRYDDDAGWVAVAVREHKPDQKEG